MRIDIRKYLDKGGEFLRRNGKILTGIVMSAGMMYISNKFDVPLWTEARYTPYRTYRQTDYTRRVIIPRNSVEASILSIAKSAESMDWDSDKIRAAEDICQIVMQNSISDETRSFAISVLSDIAEDLDWDTDKSRINKLIINIMKGSY